MCLLACVHTHIHTHPHTPVSLVKVASFSDVSRLATLVLLSSALQKVEQKQQNKIQQIPVAVTVYFT